MAMLIALSVALVAVIHFPIFPAADYLEYDPADIPVLIGTFALGPLAGIAITVIEATIQGLTVSAKSGLYGIIMHIIATSTYVIVAGNIYKRSKSKKTAGIGIIFGTIAMAAIMAGANMIVTPMFTGMPASAIKDLLLPIIVPFNLIKAGVNGVITFIIYKPISHLIHGRTGRVGGGSETKNI
jgi:riboflavin transporter FmnP